MRQTRQRKVILEVLRSTTSHPTADWIYIRARRKIPHISLGTVYRNLDLLTQQGEIRRLDYGVQNRFDGNSSNHYHFSCNDCGKVFDVDEPIHKKINQRVAQKTGFDIFYHQIEFYGKCRECKEK